MKKVLVVEDDPILRMLVHVTLGDDDVLVLEASDGVEGLAIVHAERPDVVVLDVVMPAMDGLQMCRAIKSDPELAPTPVVMVTARDGPADRAAGQAAGAQTYLTKPFSPLELIRVVEEALGLQGPSEPASDLPDELFDVDASTPLSTACALADITTDVPGARPQPA